MDKKQDEKRGNIIEVHFTQENRLSYKENNLEIYNDINKDRSR